MSWWNRKPSVRDLLALVAQGQLTLIQEFRKMSQATTNLQTAVANLQTTADAIVTKLGQPPVIQGEDPVAVQAASDQISAIDTALQAALNPAAPTA